MNIKIAKPISGGKVNAIASKSQAHRLLICAALADVETYVSCGETSDDINATVGCLENLGATISHDGAGFLVKPIMRPISGNKAISQNCKESGSTLRFMLPVCCALGIHSEFIMDGRLAERPMSPLLNELMTNGCRIIKTDDSLSMQNYPDAHVQRYNGDCGQTEDRESQDTATLAFSDRSDNSLSSVSGSILRCSGKLTGGVFELPGDISSQFITGLLFALSLLDDDSVLSVVSREESRPYIAMTLEALSAFGVTVKRFAVNPVKGATYKIKGLQSYSSPGKVAVEGDWSNAAFWLCAGAISDRGITCKGLNLGSAQGDMAITRLLERFGASVTYERDSVTVLPSKLRGIQIDAMDIPDLVPVLSVIASVAEGETMINNAARLKMKESDRLQAVTQTLYGLGADITESRANLIIKGKNSLQGGSVSSFNDHRIAMMAAIASIVCDNPVTINNAEAVNKSYPGFFKDFELLGGKVCVM